MPLQIINAYRYKHFVPSCSFVSIFFQLTQSCVKAQTHSELVVPRCSFYSFIRARALRLKSDGAEKSCDIEDASWKHGQPITAILHLQNSCGWLSMTQPPNLYAAPCDFSLMCLMCLMCLACLL